MNKRLTQRRKAQPQRRPRQSHWEDDWLEEAPEPRQAMLRFSPTAWAKLLYFRDRSEDEVGGFGITTPNDLLLVTDFLTVKQEVTCASVKFDDEAVSEFFDEQVDLGRKPEQFGRVWLHSHPGDSPEPSAIDEDTFKRVFGPCQWAVMAIVAQDNSTYVRLSFNVGPGGQVLIPTAIDYTAAFGPTDHEAWEAEYCANVRALDWLNSAPANEDRPSSNELQGAALPYDFLEEFENLEPAQRQILLDELAERPDLWNEESEVLFI